MSGMSIVCEYSTLGDDSSHEAVSKISFEASDSQASKKGVSQLARFIVSEVEQRK